MGDIEARPLHAGIFLTVEGQQFRAMIGKRAKLRAVRNVKRAIELLNETKEDLAYAVVTVPPGKLDSYLTPEQASEVLEVGWGDRSVSIMRKVAAVLPPKKVV